MNALYFQILCKCSQVIRKQVDFSKVQEWEQYEALSQTPVFPPSVPSLLSSYSCLYVPQAQQVLTGGATSPAHKGKI